MCFFCSDNHLKISFCGIEEGFSFDRLMGRWQYLALAMSIGTLIVLFIGDKEPHEAASEGEQSATMEKEDMSQRQHMKNGQFMEVELLLLKFKQSVSLQPCYTRA